MHVEEEEVLLFQPRTHLVGWLHRWAPILTQGNDDSASQGTESTLSSPEDILSQIWNRQVWALSLDKAAKVEEIMVKTLAWVTSIKLLFTFVYCSEKGNSHGKKEICTAMSDRRYEETLLCKGKAIPAALQDQRQDVADSCLHDHKPMTKTSQHLSDGLRPGSSSVVSPGCRINSLVLLKECCAASSTK